ncbi:MAG: TerB family tellurite resistance protein [Bacteroidota bacterium]
MKTIVTISLVICFCFRVTAQVQELEQLKLDIEKLAQFKLILSQMKQGYQVLQNGYNSVRDAAKGNFDLHKNYLDGLLVVNPSVKQSPALQQIVNDQTAMTKTFQTAWRQYQSSGLFSTSELNELRNKYNESVQKISDDLEVLSQVTVSEKLRMSDAERLQIMNAIRSDVSAQYAATNAMLTDYSRRLAVRAQQKRDLEALRKLNGLK